MIRTILRWLLAGRTRSASNRPSAVAAVVAGLAHVRAGRDGEVSCEAQDASWFFDGRVVHSPDGRWALAVGRRYVHSKDSWASDDPDGVAIVYRGGRCTGEVRELRRPDEFAVSSVGVFVINDSGKAGDFLGPEMCLSVYSSRGDLLTRIRRGAAIVLPALSADGRFLAFSTLSAPRSSPSPEDGDSLFLIDTETGRVRWRQDLTVVGPVAIEVCVEEELVLVKTDERPRYRFAFDGTFLDAHLVEEDRQQRERDDPYGYDFYYRAVAIASSSLSECSSEERAECLEYLEVALEKSLSPNTKARALRMKGELAELDGRMLDALQDFEAALEADPKVGLKRRVAALRRQLRP